MRTKICRISLGIVLVFVGLTGAGCTFSKNDDKKGSIYKTDDQQRSQSNSQGQQSSSQYDRQA